MTEDVISKLQLDSWTSEFQTEVQMCHGEVLQQYECHPVCHKYGNEKKCRFFFPHDVVDSSHFESQTCSVVLKCEDAYVNYHNPYILVYCRHNHDLKCILSGKSAKAAMFYISDYITKMGVKTYEMLSARLPDDVEDRSTVVQSVKMLLHKCLSQFSKQQQIHAQQV